MGWGWVVVRYLIATLVGLLMVFRVLILLFTLPPCRLFTVGLPNLAMCMDTHKLDKILRYVCRFDDGV